MSTPLCPEGVPQIDADPPSLDSGCVKGIRTASAYPDWEGTPFPKLTLLDLTTSLVRMSGDELR